jgi:transposase
MAAPRKYPDELRERAVRLAVDARRDPATRTGALRRIGDQLGINPETLRNWVTQAEIDEGHRPGTTTDDATRLAELEREVRELRRANAILKSAAAESTGQRNSSAASLSAGVSKFRVLRGREFSFAAMASRSCWVR